MKKNNKICKVSGCKSKSRTKGYCNRHHLQLNRHGKIFRTKFDLNEFNDYSDCIGIIIRGRNGNFIGEALVDREDDWIKSYRWYQSGGKRENPYVATSIDGQECLLHKLLLPNVEMIDHKNRNRLDNRKDNLRNCNKINNGRNCNLSKNNTTGVTGVYFNKLRNKWQSYITINYKIYYLGIFNNFDHAVAVRQKAEKEYFGEFAPR